MRTITPRAAQRRQTTETVRERMAHLFPAEPGYGQPPPEEWLLTSHRAVLSHALPTSDPPAEVGVGEAADAALGSADHPPPAPMRRWAALRAHPSLMLDRRAVLGLTVLLLLAVGYAVQHFWLGRPKPVPIPAASVTPATGSVARPSEPGASTEPSASVVVDIAGKVRSPGLRVLPGGSRVADALRAAGGALPDTDTDGLNLARLLADGEQILVGVPAAAAAAPGGTGPRPRISLNHATLDQLDALPGVGPALAQRILLYRQEHGGAFRSIDQLRQVSGVGERKFQDLRSLLTL